MLCACCPLLTVPKLCDNHSNSSSLSTSPTTDQLSAAVDHHDNVKSLRHSIAGRPSEYCAEDFCLISSEILQEVVKGAFSLTQEAMLLYYQQVRHQYRKKKEAKILAEDLLYQLSLLETHKHPYYAPQRFEVLVAVSYVSPQPVYISKRAVFVLIINTLLHRLLCVWRVSR